jgi:(R)-2-hydroxyacyl-CoA dehydratese activating ATPase
MTYFAGIDVGSLSADAVIIDSEKKLLGYAIVPTGHNSQESGSKAFHAALEKAGVAEADIAGILSTGYSRARVKQAGDSKTEISCHAKGAFLLFPDVSTIIDIGGQDSKAIRVGKNGRVTDFAMNDKCAAGTGRFLEVMATALDVGLGELGGLALKSDSDISISSTCTVFAESEVVSLISQGSTATDIAMAISKSIAHRTSGLVTRVGIEDRVVMTGGVAKNQAVVAALCEKIGKEIFVPEEPQIVGALGAAMFALEKESGD